MAGKVYDWPVTSNGDPEVLPWAETGAVLEPSAGQEAAGWQPYGAGPPPDYRLENYARNRQAELNRRDIAAPMFVEYPEGTVQLGGVAAGANQRRITVNGTNFDYTDQPGDTLLDVCQALALLITSDPVIGVAVSAEADTFFVGLITITSRTPGQIFTLAVAVLAGAGTIAINSAPTTAIVRAPGGVVSPALYDHVIGSTSTEDTGNPVEDARIVWDKSKGAFRAGLVTAAQWDDANRGDQSTAFGLDCSAAGAQALAAGGYSTAAGARAIALGEACIASAANAVAIGESCTASAAGAHAIGSGCTASAAFSTAIGQGATATAQNALALGIGNATGIGAVAIGGQGFSTADAIDDDDIAIGTGASADSNAGARGCLAIGVSSAATAEDAIAIGNSAAATVARATAIGYNATASGASGVAGPESTCAAATSTAFNKGATTAGQTSQFAAGENCSTSGAGSRATGKGGATATVTATGAGATAHGYTATDSATRAIVSSGTLSDAHGGAVVASADYARATGLGAKATNHGEVAHGAVYDEPGVVTDAKARHQIGHLVAQVRVVALDPLTTLCPDKTDGTGAATWTPIDDRGYAVRVQAVAKSESTGKARFWDFNLLVAKDAGVTVMSPGSQLIGAVGVPIVAATNIQPAAEIGWVWGGGAAEGPQLQVSVAGGTMLLQASGTPAAGESARLTARIEYTQAGLDY